MTRLRKFFSGLGQRPVADWFGFFAPRFVALVVFAGALLRLALAAQPVTSLAGFGALDWVRVFAVGTVNDAAVALLMLAPAFVLYLLLPEGKYRNPYKWVIFGVLAALFAYVWFWPGTLLEQHSRALLRAGRWVATVLLACFALRMAWPALRRPWRGVTLTLVVLIYLVLLVANTVGEWFFWAEFGVRYNFVAVDYLIYTNEVVGNIVESYPMVPLVGGVILVSALAFVALAGRRDLSRAGCRWLKWTVPCYIISLPLSLCWLGFAHDKLASDNAFVTELQGNGVYHFVCAFQANELDYAQFYPMLPAAEARQLSRAMCRQDSTGVQRLRPLGPEQRKNIVVVMVESLSASYLGCYGSHEGLTPVLDALAEHSIVLDSLYAVGNRTVRGLEAVTLCIPPAAGESLVKRPKQTERHSAGQLLRAKGYHTAFIYGGDSYFDNMGAFFRANGYEVLDASAFQPGEVTFGNIWGACDGDSYRMALRQFDRMAATGQPFMAHVMTISNHRPFTYPAEARLAHNGTLKGREAGIAYTDYALGEFLKEAATKPWYDNTIFLITADHCASSAGSTSLPLDNYHIPALIYAPADTLQPRHITTLCSQIDLLPTVFALLNLGGDVRYAGQDILSPDYTPRAFLATYQDLAYYRQGVLTVLSPVRKWRQLRITPLADGTFSETPLATPVTPLLRQAQAYYQSANLGYHEPQ